MKTLPHIFLLVLIWFVSAPTTAQGAALAIKSGGAVAFVTNITISPSTNITTGVSNAGMQVGAVIVTMSDSSTYSGTMTLSGADGAAFVLTNGGRLPSFLDIGSSNIGTVGTTTDFTVTITAP